MPARTVFVAGAGTEIGKTYVTVALTRSLLEQGRPVRALKPLASGVPALDDPDFAGSDTARLLAAQGFAHTPETVAACSPWRFSAPLAPDRAAALEGRSLALHDLVAWCRARMGLAEDVLLIEGVGGLMSPVTEGATGLDWLKALDVPVILVAGSYLGAISHALTACETLRLHGRDPLALVVSAGEAAPTDAEAVAAAVARHIAAPVLVLPRGGQCPDALAMLV